MERIKGDLTLLILDRIYQFFTIYKFGQFSWFFSLVLYNPWGKIQGTYHLLLTAEDVKYSSSVKNRNKSSEDLISFIWKSLIFKCNCSIIFKNGKSQVSINKLKNPKILIFIDYFFFVVCFMTIFYVPTLKVEIKLYIFIVLRFVLNHETQSKT